MLDGLRAFSKTWVAKILLAVLVVSFAAFGINNVITDLGSQTVARVGDQEISVSEFQRAYEAQINATAQQIGTVPTSEQAVSMGIPSEVLNTLSYRAAIAQLSASMGLGVSDQKLGEMLRADPNFQGILGGFDRDTFNQVMAQGGVTEADYFDGKAKEARQLQLELALFADAAVPQAAKELINRYDTDTRTIEYFVLNSTSIPMVADPTDADLAAYLAEHQADFRTVETRTADIIDLTPEALAATKTISDEEVAAEYEATKDQLVKIERRAIRQVTFPSEEIAAQFEAGKAEGKTFDEMLTAAALPVTDLGLKTKAELTDATLADAAFGLAAGDFVIIDGATGKRAVVVSEIQPGGQTTLEEAREDIRQSLALEAAKEEYVDILDQIEELRAAFQPMDQIASRYGLTLYTIPVTAAGAELSQVPGIDAADYARVSDTIFKAEQGKLSPTIAINANHNIWIDLKSVEPARDQTLDEVREAVTTAWTEAKTNEAIIAEVEKAKTQLEGGQKTITDIATALNAFPQISAPLDRSGDGTPILSAGVAAAVFSGGADHFGAAQNDDGDYVVFKVSEVTPSTDPISADVTQFIDGSTRNSMFGEFVAGLRQDYGLVQNNQVLFSILGLDPTAGN